MTELQQISIEPIHSWDRTWVRETLLRRWASPLVATHGYLVDASKLDGYIASESHRRLGLITYETFMNKIRITTIDNLVEIHGICRLLIDELYILAKSQEKSRLVVTITNDNTDALAFFQKMGFQISEVFLDSVKHSRSVKPSLPLIGNNGIPIRDEIELELPVPI